MFRLFQGLVIFVVFLLSSIWQTKGESICHCPQIAVNGEFSLSLSADSCCKQDQCSQSGKLNWSLPSKTATMHHQHDLVQFHLNYTSFSFGNLVSEIPRPIFEEEFRAFPIPSPFSSLLSQFLSTQFVPLFIVGGLGFLPPLLI